MLKCEYFPLCSGCEIQGNVSPPPIWGDLVHFLTLLIPDHHIPFVAKEITGWRSRSKLAVRGDYRNPEIGLFKKGSHDVVSIPTCPLHHPAINKTYQIVRATLFEQKIIPYDEKGNGVIRYLQFVVDRRTLKIQLTVVVNRMRFDSSLERFVKLLYNRADLHSIWLNFQPLQTNRIFGDEWQLMDGETYLWEHLHKVWCAFHPACFGQSHLTLFEEVLRRITGWIGSDRRVLELYAGIGVIGLNLASQGNQIMCVEQNPYAAECFELSRLRLASESQKKISMHITSSEKAVDLFTNQEVIIVDPPRKGLDTKVLDSICESQAKQLVYLSCGPLSFQRDCEILVSRGWKIDQVEGYLFFPGSNHVEILCNFKK